MLGRPVSGPRHGSPCLGDPCSRAAAYVWGMGSHPGETMREQPDEVVTAQESSALARELSNWNRRGRDDQRGALHFLTPQRIAAATGLVRDGITVSLSLPLNTTPAIRNPVPADHHMMAPTDLDHGDEALEFMKDYVGLDYHNDGHTHIGSLCHVADQGVLYNDRPQAAVTGHGAAANSIEVLKDGRVGRGVLLDIRLRGLPWLEPGQHLAAPLRILGGTGSSINPVAVL
jgi:hypothetical protein